MGKIASDHAAALDLPAMVAERFPLLPRAKPVCRALTTRLAQVHEWADRASQGTDESLMRAAEAHNLAALIASDCGLPDLARGLCREQFDVFLTVRPLDAAMAKLALQPLINLGRLLIRAGDGTAAYHLLDSLFQATKSRTDTVIDGRTIPLAELVGRDDDDHREIVQWMWSILLADGTRALTRAGRWSEALQHVHQHKGIGKHLLDGRQVAVLARCEAGDYDTALRLLTDSATPAAWEKAIAACMTALCGVWADRPSEADLATMTDRYLALEPAPEHVVFQVRLGLCVIDMATSDRETLQVSNMVVHRALEAADAYAARDVLAHETCLAHTTIDVSQALTEMVRESGLVTSPSAGSETLEGPLLDSLLNSAQVAEEALTASLLQAGHHR